MRTITIIALTSLLVGCSSHDFPLAGQVNGTRLLVDGKFADVSKPIDVKVVTKEDGHLWIVPADRD